MGAGRTEQGPKAPESRQPPSYCRPSACGGGNSGDPMFSREGFKEEDGGGGVGEGRRDIGMGGQ